MLLFRVIIEDWNGKSIIHPKKFGPARVKLRESNITVNCKINLTSLLNYGIERKYYPEVSSCTLNSFTAISISSFVMTKELSEIRQNPYNNPGIHDISAARFRDSNWMHWAQYVSYKPDCLCKCLVTCSNKSFLSLADFSVTREDRYFAASL